MRKYLIILMATLFMVACGNKIHEDIDNGLAEDSKQVFDILLTSIDDGIMVDDLDKENVTILNSYGDKYNEEDRDSAVILNNVEEEIVTFTLASITRYVGYTGLESDKEKIMETKTNVEKMIKTGKDYAEINK